MANGISMGKFVAAIIIAILVSSAASIGISMQLIKGTSGQQGATGPTGATGAQGPPGPQGPYLPNYDSGWVNITDKAGQSFTLIHNLSSIDVIVDVTGKLAQANATHQFLGLSDFMDGFETTYGGPTNEEAYSVIQTSEGGYAIAGWTDSFGTDNVDVYLIKTDGWGTIQWNKTYGGAGFDVGYSLVQTPDGGYAIAGWTDSFGADDIDVYLIKTDWAGVMQWNRTYGGAFTQRGYSLVRTLDGGYVIVGSTESAVRLDDVYLVKTDATGNMQWNKSYGGPGYDHGYSVVRTPDGGYAIAGGTMSFGAGDMDVYLVKTDASGNMQWNKTSGVTDYDVGFSLIRTSDGGYAIAGSAGSFGPLLNDVYLVKTDSAGNMQWNKTYDGAGYSEGRSLVQTPDGGYAIAGRTGSSRLGHSDVYLVRIDAAGTVLWMKTYGRAELDFGYSIIETADGGYVIAGYTYYTSGLRDIYLVKTALESGLAWIATSNTITLYRGTADVYWNYVRVRIWMVKESA